MKQNWEYSTFGQIMTPAKVERCKSRTDLPILSITMHDGIVFQSSRFKKVIASVSTENYKIVRNGQLVIAFPIDEGLIYTQDVVGMGIMSPAYNVWDVDYTKVERRFLVKYFHSPNAMRYYKLKLRGTTQRRRNLPKEDLLSMPIPIPPLSVQSRIVAELDLLTGIIDKQNAQLKELDNLAQAIFYDMFGDPIENPKGWEVKKLGDVCDVRDGTHDSPDYVDDGYPLVTSKNVADGKISFENVNYINEADFISISKRSKVDDGDIIMPMIGTIGKPVIVSKTREFAIKNVALIKFYEDGSVMNVFIRSIISSDSFDAYMKTKNKGGTQKFIALGDVRKLNIPVPPLALQQSFAEKIQSIEKQKETIRASIADTQKLLDYTMDKYFG